MKMLTAVTSVSLLGLSSMALAQSEEVTPGRELSELIFGSIEDDPEGAADMGEFVNFGKDIFVSMDANENLSIDQIEFMEWDFGFDYIAEDEGQVRSFETAKKIIFAIWDQDADGRISKSEYDKAMVTDFRRADTDNDALLSREEFLSGYIVILAYRAAILGE